MNYSSNLYFLQGYRQRRAYIATQGPLSGTVVDMWRMIWENNCSCVVMLCQTIEMGQVYFFLKLCLPSVSCLFFFLLQQESSCCFWPQSLEEKSIFGNIRVCLKRVSNEGHALHITHTIMHLYLWVDFEPRRNVQFLQRCGHKSIGVGRGRGGGGG